MRLLVVLALLLLLTGCGGREEEVSPSAADEVEADVGVGEATPTASASALPSRAPAPTPSPTPLLSELPVEVQRSVIAGSISANVAGLEEVRRAIAEDSIVIESIEQLDYNTAEHRFDMRMTTSFTGEEYIRETAYDIATDLAPMAWTDTGPDSLGAAHPDALPGLQIQADGLTFTCSGATMSRLAAHALSQESFAAEC